MTTGGIRSFTFTPEDGVPPAVAPFAQRTTCWAAVESGTGMAAWHGAAAAFRASLRYHLMLGGDFVAHPAGEGYPQPYMVRITNTEHPVTVGVNDFPVASEQYYIHTDHNNTVLAETTFDGEHFSWLDGLSSPRGSAPGGRGRVFYHSIGHSPEDLDGADVRRLTKQGIAWAARGGATA